MGGRAGQSQTQTSTTTLPPGQQQNVDTLMAGARDYYNTGGPQYYGGNTVAQPTGAELAGRTAATGYATGAGSDFIKNYQGGENFWLNPSNIFNPSNIPGFNNVTQGVTRDVTRNLTENILPNIRAGSVATGALGSPTEGISSGLAIGRTNDALARTLGELNMGAYNSGLNMYNSAASRAPQTYGLGLAPANTLQQVGGAQRADEQANIDAALKKFNFEQLRPLLNLQTLQALTGTAGQYGGTNTTTGSAGTSGGNTGGLQGIGALLSLVSLLGGG